MKNILIIGATGQIGSELTMNLRSIYGNNHVVAGYIKGAEPKGILLESGPAEEADVRDGAMLAAIVTSAIAPARRPAAFNLSRIQQQAAVIMPVSPASKPMEPPNTSGSRKLTVPFAAPTW